MRLQLLKSRKNNFIFSQKVNEIKTILCPENYWTREIKLH